jgi:hypothetical protein
MPTCPTPDPELLMAYLRSADADLAAAGADGAIIRLSELPPGAASFGWFPLDGAHPLDVLLGFVAPPHWRALGMSTAGHARPLDQLGGPSRGPTAAGGAFASPSPAASATAAPDGDGDGVAVTVTVLVDRSGAAAGLMRRGDVVTPLPGRPDGLVADACRRALGLPTSPPPASTLVLWTLAWLDRVVDAAGRADAATRLTSWPAVARLHLAATVPDATSPGALGPAALAGAAAALARAWPWGRLRRDPSGADVPGPPPSPQLAQWMDDGMWARWLLSRLPAADDLLSAVHALLPPTLAEQVERVAAEAWR